MRVDHVTPRNRSEAVEWLKKGINSRQWIVFFAECLVEYEGRAASKSTYGDKLVMIKPNGSVIIHGPRGFKPQNWQPDTVAITVEESGDEVILRAIRKKPREILVIKCPEVYHIMLGQEPVEGDFWMYINEHQIRDLIAEMPSLIEEGMRIVSVEKPVEPGFVDLYGRDKEGRLVVIELKRVKAGEEAVHQLLRYVEAFNKRGVNVRPILAAPDFTDSARTLASRSGVELKRLDLKGIYDLIKRKERRRPGTLTEYF